MKIHKYILSIIFLISVTPVLQATPVKVEVSINLDIPECVETYIKSWNLGDSKSFFDSYKSKFRNCENVPASLVKRYSSYTQHVESVWPFGEESYTITYSVKYRDLLVPESLKNLKEGGIDPPILVTERYLIKNGQLLEVVTWERINGSDLSGADPGVLNSKLFHDLIVEYRSTYIRYLKRVDEVSRTTRGEMKPPSTKSE